MHANLFRRQWLSKLSRQSSHQAEIVFQTFVNETRIRKATALEQHDQVRFGDDELCFAIEYSQDDGDRSASSPVCHFLFLTV